MDNSPAHPSFQANQSHYSLSLNHIESTLYSNIIMSATTTPQSFLHNSNVFSTLPTKNGPLKAVTVPTGGLMALITTNRSASSSNAKSTLFFGHKTCQVSDIAEEALRLTRETHDGTHDTQTTINHGDPVTPHNKHTPTVSPITSPHRTQRRTSSSAAAAAATTTPGVRLNKFVRRLHDMLVAEKDSGIVEWRRGLLVLHSTDVFAKQILPKYFNTRNFKTFRRQLNYYGFVHVRSFSTTGTSTTALWVNRDLAAQTTGSSSSPPDNISSVLLLRRVEPNESAKTTEGRRVRKELAIHTVEEDLGFSAKTLQMEQIRSLAHRYDDGVSASSSPDASSSTRTGTAIPSVIRFPRTVSTSTSSSGSGSSSDVKHHHTHHQLPQQQQQHRRRVSSLDSGVAATTTTSNSMPLCTIPTEVTETTSCSDDEESAANLLLNLSKLA